MASKASEAHALAPQLILVCISNTRDSSEFKHGVYGKRETAIAAFDFLFFSPILKSIQEKNGKKNSHIHNAYKQRKAEGESSSYAVCRSRGRKHRAKAF